METNRKQPGSEIAPCLEIWEKLAKVQWHLD